MHFCSGLPIILVGCKKDLRREPRVIEELRKTNQRPVTPEEVSHASLLLITSFYTNTFRSMIRIGITVHAGFNSPYLTH